jgi:hypothetical protein
MRTHLYVKTPKVTAIESDTGAIPLNCVCEHIRTLDSQSRLRNFLKHWVASE